MTDRELLELAAKAAGIKIDKSIQNGAPDRSGFDMQGNVVLDWHNGKTWNPITDDGDAFRLAVKLNLFDENAKFTYGLAVAMNEFSEPCEATRRAIVRAAAELGRKPTDGATPVK